MYDNVVPCLMSVQNVGQWKDKQPHHKVNQGEEKRVDYVKDAIVQAQNEYNCGVLNYIQSSFDFSGYLGQPSTVLCQLPDLDFLYQVDLLDMLLWQKSGQTHLQSKAKAICCFMKQNCQFQRYKAIQI